MGSPVLKDKCKIISFAGSAVGRNPSRQCATPVYSVTENWSVTLYLSVPLP